MDRRSFLQTSSAFAALSLAGCKTLRSAAPATAPTLPWYDPIVPIAPIHADASRLFKITVCTRPFRATGPRIEAERFGDKIVIHNYGHGGSGWSLSWGSGTVAVQMAMAASPAEIAVIGCGALGLTAAILAQRAGARVTIYARDLISDTRSARATGSFTPDSRIALTDKAAPGFPALWEKMARVSFHTYRNYLGLPGAPVEFTDRYFLEDASLGVGPAIESPHPAALDFASYGDLIRDLTPHATLLSPGATPFPSQNVRRSSQLMFNIADYAHTLMTDFLVAGGKLERREFHEPAELAALPQTVVINCPGYGARALWKDESVVPVRGQIAWLMPQPEVNYGVYFGEMGVLARRDGIVLQMFDGGDMRGYGDDREVADPDEAKTSVARVAALYAGFGKGAAPS